tara:strand:+ start:3061 stop:3606 length:546 start_codon:yes stop_codon:yes gene_type:complete
MAQTRQTIQNFYTQAQSKDFARNNLFRVLNINFGGGTDINFDEDDLIYAKTAKLPGKEVTSQVVPYMGLNFNIPGVVKYPGSEGYTISFRCDESYDLRNRFLEVLNNTFDDSDSTGNYFMPTADSVIDLALLDKQLDRISQFQLVGVALKSVGELSYDVTQDGTVQDFDVSLTYHYFRQTA